MLKAPLQVDEQLYAYILASGVRDDPVLSALRDETNRMPDGVMQVSPEQGQFMALLVKLAGVRTAVEIGTFTGYSSLCVARALPDGGRLTCCDVSEEYTSVARRYWALAGVADRIDLRIGQALDTLRDIREQSGAGSIDMVFIDADKRNYRNYYEASLDLVRAGGLILIDNVLWGGDVARPSISDTDTTAIRDLNALIAVDRRVDISLLPIADGLTIARKK